jgi:hypothetical protein
LQEGDRTPTSRNLPMKKRRSLIFSLFVAVIMISAGLLYADQQTLLQGVIQESGWYGGPVLKVGGINNSPAVFVGYRGGWVINRTLSLGGGGYGLVSDLYFSGNKLKMGYGGLELEYKINPDALVHFTIHSLLGFGGLELMGVGQESFFTFEPGAGIELNVAQFFKVNAGVSYRLVSGANQVAGISDANLSGLTGELALMFGFSGIMGSGRKISEIRDLPDFHSIDFRGNGKILIGQGERQSVTIRADDNVMDKLRTEVSDGRLEISAEKWVVDESSVLYDIVVTDIREISISGMGEIEGRDTIGAEQLTLRLRGTGEITLALDAQRLMSTISGTGEMRLEGTAEEHDIDIKGVGELHAYDLAVRSARVVITGAGECKVNVIDDLTVDISGAGSVLYKGDPNVTVEHLSIAGDLERKD